MMEINYQKELDKILKTIDSDGDKPSLLLHACCAPCSSYCVEYLHKYFNITIFFYNPNMDNSTEYEKRLGEFSKIVDLYSDIKVISPAYNSMEFYEKVKGYEQEKEGGERCFICYRLRLEATAKYASENGFDYFASTLSISPFKNAKMLNIIGQQLESEYNVKHLPNDFKKNGGYKRSIVLSHELNLYRQNYCGCVYSKYERIKIKEKTENDG